MSSDSNAAGGTLVPGSIPIIAEVDNNDGSTLLQEKQQHSSSILGAVMTHDRHNPQDSELDGIAKKALCTHYVFQNCLCPHSFSYGVSEDSPAIDRISALPPIVHTHSPAADLAQQAFCAGVNFASQGQLVSYSPPDRLSLFSSSDQPSSFSSSGRLSSFQFNPIFLNITPARLETAQSAEDELVITDSLIDLFNTPGGNHEETIKKLISKMRRLGGLDPRQPGEKRDIPSARLGLCRLARLETEEYKKEALESLLAILHADYGGQETASKLIRLAIEYTQQMDRNLIQTYTLEIQIISAKVYNLIIDAIYSHYEKKNLNAITEELRVLFSQTAVSFGKLNRQENSALKFYVRSALQGSLLLVDDSEPLFELLERLYHLGAAATSFYLTDAQSAFPHLEKSVHDLQTHHLKSSWYKTALALKCLARQTSKDMGPLTSILLLIEKSRHKLNWRFSYAAILTLTDLCINGETETIRHHAFYGIEIDLPKGKKIKLPGLLDFASSNDLAKYPSLAPLKHFKTPKMVDPNPRIQEISEECLRQVALSSPDQSIREGSESTLLR